MPCHVHALGEAFRDCSFSQVSWNSRLLHQSTGFSQQQLWPLAFGLRMAEVLAGSAQQGNVEKACEPLLEAARATLELAAGLIPQAPVEQ